MSNPKLNAGQTHALNSHGRASAAHGAYSNRGNR